MGNLDVDGAGDDNDGNDGPKKEEEEGNIHSYSLWLNVSMSMKREQNMGPARMRWILARCVWQTE